MNRGPWRWSSWSIALLLIPLALLTLPLLTLVVAGAGISFLGLAQSASARSALWLTLWTSLIATLFVALIGTPVAFLLGRVRDPRLRSLLETIVDLPLALPPVVLGLALLLLLGRNGWLGGMMEPAGIRVPFTAAAVVVAQAVVASPLYIRAARSGFAGVPAHLEETGMTLGLSPGRLFWTVSLPLARHGIAAGLALAWVRSVSEFGATLMFAGNMEGVTQTLPLAVMTAMQRPEGVSLAIGLSLLSLSVAALSLLVARNWQTVRG